MLSSNFTPAIRKKSVFLLAAIALVLSCRVGMTTQDPGSSVEAGTHPGGSESRSLSDAPLPSPVIPRTAAPKARSNAYYPNAPLKPQIAMLRDAAEKGDRHAECVLSRALLLCRKGADDSLLTPYSNHYLTSLRASELESLTTRILSRESVVSAICDGIDKRDLAETDETIFRSAILGDIAAMRLFVMPPYARTWPQHANAEQALFADRYERYAEAMINHAANAGDPGALEMVFFAYATGHYESGPARLDVERDPARSMAAFRALKAVGAYRLESRYEPDYLAQVDESIDRELSMLSDADKSRMAEMEKAYTRAYLSERRESSILDEISNELPEQACAKVDARGNGNRSAFASSADLLPSALPRPAHRGS